MSDLSVIVTRWPEHTEDAYAIVTLGPPAGDDGTWRDRMAALLAANRHEDEVDLILPSAPHQGVDITNRIRAYWNRPDDPPSVTLRRPPTRGIPR